MATTTKRGSKTTKTKQLRPKLKTSVAKQAQTIAELRQELEARNRDLAESLQRESATASENERLSKELQERNTELREALEQQTATSEILGVIASSPTDIQPVVDVIAENAARICDDAEIFQVDGDVLRLVAHHGHMPLVGALGSTILPLSRDLISSRAVIDRQTIHISDVLQVLESEFPGVRARQRTAGTRTVLATPLMREETAVGVIVIRRKEVAPFSKKQINLLKIFADQSVIAIENVRLFKEIQERNSELREALEHQTATAEVLGIINRSPTDEQPVLDAIVESAARVCGIDDVVLRLREGDMMSPRAHFGPVPITRVQISVDEPVFHWIREHGTLHIPDIDEQTEVQSPNFTGNWRTVLYVPLRQRTEVIGHLTARRIQFGPFTPAQIKLLETFADQAVIALENVRLFQELKESLEQQTATSNILQVIASSPTDIRPVLDAVAESAVRLCAAEDASIRLVEGNLLRLGAHYGTIPMTGAEQARPMNRQSVMGRAAVDRQLIHLEDLQLVNDTEFSGNRAAGRVIHTMLATPLLREGVAIAVIGLRRTEVRPFTDKQIALLKTFADQAAIAIENVRLFKELQERNAELREALEHQTATSEVLGIISRSPTDVQPVLDAIVESAAKVCGIDDVVLRFRDGDVMVARAHFGPIPMPRNEVSVDAPEFRWVREHGTLHIPDLREQRNDFPGLGSIIGFLTFLAAPLRQQGELIGSLSARRIEARPFTPTQIKLLETFANQAVIALENVRLFQELKESLEQQTATSEILGVIASSPTDIQPVMDTIAENAAKVCGANDAVIRLVQSNVLRTTAHYGPVPNVAEERPIDRQSPGGRAVLDRAVIHIPDIGSVVQTEFPAVYDTYLQIGGGTTLNVPLMREALAIGVIHIRRMEVRPFSDKQIRLLQTFADQAVIAIENVRLFKEIQERNAELREALEHQTASSEVLSIISRSPTDVQPVLDAIVESAARVCGIDDVVLRLRERDFMIVRAHLGSVPLPSVEISIDAPPVRWMREHGTLHIPDIRTQGDIPLISPGPKRTFLLVPLRQQGELIGVLVARRTEVQPFTPAQIKLLQTFADQAVIAIENVRLFNELKESLEQQTATSEILGVIASSPTDIQPVLDVVAKNAARLCDAVDGVITRPEGDTLRVVAKYGEVPVPEVLPLTRGFPGGRAVIDRQTIHIHDIAAEVDSEYPEARLAQQLSGTRTALNAPLLREGVAIGGIGVRRTDVRPFSDKQIKLLETFASQAVIAIENVRLFQELKDALEQQTATSEILGVIASSPTDIQPVLDTIAESAARVCGANDASIRLAEGNMLHLAAHYGPIPFLTAVDLPIDRDSVAGRAVVERQLIHIEDLLPVVAMQFPRTKTFSDQEGNRTVLVVPLMRDEVPIGTVLIRRTEIRPFTEKQIALLKTFADQAVIAIENVRLFKELQERNAELREALEHQTATSEVLGIISRSPTDVQPVLDAIVESAAKVCGIDDVVLRLHDGNILVPAAHFGPIPITRAEISVDEPYLQWIGEHGTLHIPDIREKNDFPMVNFSGRWRTVLYAPLRQQGEIIGHLTARRIELCPFRPAQIKLLETFADQAVIAIENVRLFQELKESLEQQTATSEILGVIASSPTDTQPVLDVVAENAARLCEADDSQILRVEEDVLQRAASYGSRQTAEARPVTREIVAGRAVIDRQIVHVHDIRAAQDQGFPGNQAFGLGGSRTLLAAPLLREGVSIGVVLIRRFQVRPFTDKQIALLKTFADQAVIAIENVRLFKEIQERNAELREALEHQTATSEVLGIISRSPTDVQPVLDAIVESAARVCGIDDVLLRLQQGDVMVSRAHFGPIPVAHVEQSIDRPHIRWMRDNGTLHIPDVRAQSDFLSMGSIGGFFTYLGIPLRHKNQFIGALAARRLEVHPFTPPQIKLLETFADQAVIAIENVRLFQELKESLEQQTATSEILGVIARSPTDLQPVLNVVAENAARLCEATDAMILRVDGDNLRTAAKFGPIAAADSRKITRGFPGGRAVIDGQTVHVDDMTAEMIQTEFPDARGL